MRPGPSLREHKGCWAPPLSPEFFWDEEFGGGPIERCPVAILHECEWWAEFRDAYMFWKEGLFPVNGGWMDQSHILVEAIRYFDGELADYE